MNDKKNNVCKLPEKDVNEIVPGLWLGNHVSARDKIFLDKFNIKYIINITENVPNLFQDIKYLRFPVRDKETCSIDTIKIFDISGRFIMNALKNGIGVLVHCKRGHHRSATIVAAFLMKYLKVNYITAIAYINYLRNCALRRKTCMMDGLFNYYLLLNGIKCKESKCGKVNNFFFCSCYK